MFTTGEDMFKPSVASATVRCLLFIVAPIVLCGFFCVFFVCFFFGGVGVG